jgi:beta-glucosidase
MWTTSECRCSPSGFGLSYTTFHYDHLSVQGPQPGSKEPIQVSVDVTNTGEREGDEIAQLYVRNDMSSVETPERSLAGFSRIHLSPGETRLVTFSIRQEQLAVWNAEKTWVIESGNYTIWVGGSSEATLSASLRLRP